VKSFALMVGGMCKYRAHGLRGDTGRSLGGRVCDWTEKRHSEPYAELV
jgi:hypothetical protein